MSIYVYIFTMAITTYLVRMLPLTLFRKPIKSPFIRTRKELTFVADKCGFFSTKSVLSDGINPTYVG